MSPRARSRVFDAAIAAVIFGGLLIGYLMAYQLRVLSIELGRVAGGIALIALMSVPLAWRRMAPVAVLAISSAAYVFHAALDLSFVSPFAMVVAIFTVAAYTEKRTAITAGALGIGATLGATWLHVRAGRASEIEIATVALALAAIWLVGWRIGRSRARTADLEHKAARLERERAERDHAAAAEERARIARDLHDVVSHNLSVMVVQAGGARRIAGTDPARAHAALSEIESTGRQALTEMRRLLGLMRVDGEAALEPTCGVDALGELVERVRTAGVPVELSVTGSRPDPLPQGVDVSVYRIVQEALTNVIKHAGSARARVSVTFTEGDVTVTVTDDGTAAPGADGGGHGLVGMRERVALFGGRLHAGPRPDGGFEVVAVLPVEGAGA